MSVSPKKAAKEAERERRRLAVEAGLDEARVWTESVLEQALPPASAEPRSLHEAMRYAVLGGGKRIRAALAREWCRRFGGLDVDAAPVAAALECVHAYSLVHDDLPCMDDDDLRRGRPTVHKVWDEAMAVLAGDALLTHAFVLLARVRPAGAEAVLVLADASGSYGMVGGQVLDLAAQAGADAESVESIHRTKTAALLGAACELGALVGCARAPERSLVREYGVELGLLFQVIDDVLDCTSDAATLGKTPGKDAQAQKATMVAALGLEGAKERAAEHAKRATELAERLGAVEGDLLYDLPQALLARKA
jgi:farnesyl diphosphate synthase